VFRHQISLSPTVSFVLLYSAATRNPSSSFLPLWVVFLPQVLLHGISNQVFCSILYNYPFGMILPGHCNLLNVIYFSITGPSDNS
jgi:hypothetical protein